jgi:hypothetical protein
VSKTYFQSPFGIAQHPWLSKADTKFNADGLFKTGLVMPPSSETEAFVDFVKAEAQKAFDEEAEKMTPAERKKYTLYCPVEEEQDDQGNPTGNWVAHFKQNALIKRRDGTEIVVKIGIKDASGKKDVRKPVYSGSELRVMYSPRLVKIASARQVGVRLDFASVQIKVLNSGGPRGFGAVDGYEEELDDRDQAAFDPAEPDKPVHGDY